MDNEKSLDPRKRATVASNVKTMLTVFFDQEGIVHHKYAP